MIFDFGPFNHTGEAKGLFIHHGGAFAGHMDKFWKENAIHKTDNESYEKDGKDELGNFSFFQRVMCPFDTEKKEKKHQDVMNPIHHSMARKGPKILPKTVTLNPKVKEIKRFLIKPVPKKARNRVHPANKNKENNKRGD